MTRFLIIREVAEGAARLVGVTDDTAMAPAEIIDWWASRLARVSEPIKLYIAPAEAIEAFSVVPGEPIVPVNVKPIPLREAFSLDQPINLPK